MQQSSKTVQRSYNRGAFQQAFDGRLMSDFPPQLSESSYQRRSQDSKAHSDDEVEVRRGLESEHARSDMDNNPELLR